MGPLRLPVRRRRIAAPRPAVRVTSRDAPAQACDKRLGLVLDEVFLKLSLGGERRTRAADLVMDGAGIPTPRRAKLLGRGSLGPYRRLELLKHPKAQRPRPFSNGQPVVAEAPIRALLDQAGALERLELLAHRGLRDVQPGHQVRDAALAERRRLLGRVKEAGKAAKGAAGDAGRVVGHRHALDAQRGGRTARVTGPPKRAPSRAVARSGARLPSGYATFLDEVKARVRAAQVKAALGVNRELVLLYWRIGRDILARQKKEGWGAQVIDRLSADLRAAFPEMHGFSPRSLKYVRSFAAAWSDDAIVQAPLAQLTWYHHLALLEKVDSSEHRLWYARQTIVHGWSCNVLVAQMESGLHERTGKALTNFKALPPPRSDLAQQTLSLPSIEQLEKDLAVKPKGTR